MKFRIGFFVGNRNFRNIKSTVSMAYTTITVFMLSIAGCCMAQEAIPTISPSATYYGIDGSEIETDDKSAPLTGKFFANAANTEGWTCNYEWRFTKENATEPYLIRYEEDTEVLFTEYGTTSIVCYATFVNERDSVVYGKEFWEAEMSPLRVSISSSKLEMPNAFSPNGDDINDIYKPKEGWKSIVEFKATIFNRWGQKIFEWSDPSTGWDGTHNGTPVKEGVYYCLVKALGADGIRYNIKRDVNLLRGYTESAGNTQQ